jgi:hypothetical protein
VIFEHPIVGMAEKLGELPRRLKIYDRFNGAAGRDRRP